VTLVAGLVDFSNKGMFCLTGVFRCFKVVYSSGRCGLDKDDGRCLAGLQSTDEHEDGTAMAMQIQVLSRA